MLLTSEATNINVVRCTEHMCWICYDGRHDVLIQCRQISRLSMCTIHISLQLGQLPAVTRQTCDAAALHVLTSAFCFSTGSSTCQHLGSCFAGMVGLFAASRRSCSISCCTMRVTNTTATGQLQNDTGGTAAVQQQYSIIIYLAAVQVTPEQQVARGSWYRNQQLLVDVTFFLNAP